MIGAQNTQGQKYWVGIVRWAPETLVSEEIADIFTNYNIDGPRRPKYNWNRLKKTLNLMFGPISRLALAISQWLSKICVIWLRLLAKLAKETSMISCSLQFS